jgi:spore germination protein
MEFTKKRIIYTIVVTLIVVFSTTFAILMTLERMDYRNYLQGEYSKSMYDLINSVQNIQVNLGKAEIIGSKEQSIVVFEEIFRHSTMANDKLHSLPIPQETIERTSKFLSQVGDFCYILSKASSENRELSDEEYVAIDKLRTQSFELQGNLNGVLSEINEGKVKWGEIRKKASGVFAKADANVVAEQFKGIEKQVSQYPSLIYDGPFSDNILSIKPKIESQNQVSEKEATEIAKTIVGKDRIESVISKANEGKTKINSYNFSIAIKGRNDAEGKIACEISKNGGKVVYLLDNRKLNKATMDLKTAVDKGRKYLESVGYKGMVASYTLNYDSNVLVNYVYNQKNIIIYPDAIKLKIALDDGSIIGIESEKYLVSHEENRVIVEPKVTSDEAKKRVGKRLEINSIRLAIVPTITNKEALCYEFSGNYKEDKYIVYINALTGFEERILQIQNTPNGELTM